MTTTTDITTLAPNKLWQWFATICNIPHASYQEEALACHITQWAANKGLDTYRDKVGNVFIKKPASQGMAHCPPIALQAHLDMVTESNDDYDFNTLPIIPRVDGDWVRASGTTLGADNGIGLASILAVLDSDDLVHPPIEAVLTMTEETGMEGAFGLERGRLASKTMINTDTEEVGEIYIGCAGGVDAEISLTLERETIQGSILKVGITGLKGGHSGIDIDKNNSNAIKLLANWLSGLPINLVQLQGGNARNAIARQAFAIITYQDSKVPDKLQKRAKALQTLIKGFETEAVFDISKHQTDDDTMVNAFDSQKAIHLINSLPNGVLRYSDTIKGTAETSLSLGKVILDSERLFAVSLIRSLNDTGKATACRQVHSTTALANASVSFIGSYVGWEPNPSSPITKVAFEVYQEVIGKAPALKVIHAGLECGLIQQAYPDMDIVSIGPTIKNAHSPDECVDIASVATYWQVLTGILARATQ